MKIYRVFGDKPKLKAHIVGTNGVTLCKKESDPNLPHALVRNYEERPADNPLCEICQSRWHPSFEEKKAEPRDVFTTRDEFAMAAMNGLVAPVHVPDLLAERAYAIADAMLKEREKK